MGRGIERKKILNDKDREGLYNTTVGNGGERHAFDPRILGDSEFVQEITSGLDDIMKRNLRVSGHHMDLDRLSERVCKN